MPEGTEDNIEKIAKEIRKVKETEPATDVCDTSSPGEPVPAPYPETAMSSDTSSSSRKVKIEGSDAMVKESAFEKSAGDEPGQSDSNIDKAIEIVKANKVLGVPLWIWGFSIVALIVIIWALSTNILQPALQPSEPIEQQAVHLVSSFS